MTVRKPKDQRDRHAEPAQPDAAAAARQRARERAGADEYPRKSGRAKGKGGTS